MNKAIGLFVLLNILFTQELFNSIQKYNEVVSVFITSKKPNKILKKSKADYKDITSNVESGFLAELNIFFFIDRENIDPSKNYSYKAIFDTKTLDYDVKEKNFNVQISTSYSNIYSNVSELNIYKYHFDSGIGTTLFLYGLNDLLMFNEGEVKKLSNLKTLVKNVEGELLNNTKNNINTFKILKNKVFINTYNLNNKEVKSSKVYEDKNGISYPFRNIIVSQDGSVLFLENEASQNYTICIDNLVFSTKKFNDTYIKKIFRYNSNEIVLSVLTNTGKFQFVQYDFLNDFILKKKNIELLFSSHNRLIFKDENKLWYEDKNKQKVLPQNIPHDARVLGQTKTKIYFRAQNKIYQYDTGINMCKIILELDNITSSRLINNFILINTYDFKTLYVVELNEF